MATKEQIQALKNRIDCRELINQFGINFNGQNISCLNPSHPDRNPSMAVYKEHALCFSCGCNLDAIGIVQNLQNLSFKEAIDYLASKYNYYIENKTFNNSSDSINKKYNYVKKEKANKYNTKIENDASVKNQLWQILSSVEPTKEALEWFSKRNISPDTAWKMGCRDIAPAINAISDLIEHTEFEILKSNNFINNVDGLWSPIINSIKRNPEYSGIIIPIFDLDNNVHSFRWRLYNPIKKNIKSKEVVIKVLGQPSCSLMPAGLNFAKKMTQKNEIFICEGEPDWLSMNTIFNEQNSNDKFAIGFCALSNNWDEEWTKILSEFKKINFCLHNTDKAKKISNIIQDSIINYTKNNYWKKNIFEYYFDEKNDINDHLKRNDPFLNSIPLKLKYYNLDLKANRLEQLCSFRKYESNWTFLDSDEEQALLRENLKKSLVIPKGDVGLFVAAGGTGKTQLLMQLVTALGTNTKWLDFFERGEAKGKICYVFGEENDQRIQRRFRKVFEGLNLSKEKRLEFEENVCLLSMQSIDATFSYENENSFQKEIISLLNKYADNDGWSLIIFDPASRFLPPNAEIDNAAATGFIRECEKISKEVSGNPTILVSHHVNKSSINGAKLFSEEFDSNQSASRGASGLVDGARFVINVDSILKEDWLKTTHYANKKLLKVKHSKINCGPFMHQVNAVVDDDGIIYALSESEEEDLKAIKASFLSTKIQKNSSSYLV